MNTRLSKVGELVRRELAELIARGDLRDPRLRDVAAVSVTGVKVAADLSSARVFVDVFGQGRRQAVVDGLNAAAGRLRAQLGDRVRLKRTPHLRFEVDPSIASGQAIEQILAEINAEDD